MAWFILQNDVTANEFKNIWEPQRNHWIIKPNLEEEPNFAYFPAKTDSNVPVLIESVTKLDPDFQQFHKFKLNKKNFSPWTQTSRAEKIAPFDRNHEVVAPPNSPACEDKAGQDKDRSKGAQLFMLELLTRINEEKKQFENSVKVANPFGAIGTIPGQPRWGPPMMDKEYIEAFGPLDSERYEFEQNGKPSQPYENIYNHLPLNNVALNENEGDLIPRAPSPRYFGGVGPLDDYTQDFLYHLRKNSHENYGTQLANDRAKFLDQMTLRAESPTPVTSTFDPTVLTELPELIVEPVICSDPIRAFIQDTSEWPSDRPDNLWSDIDDFIVNGIMSRKRSGSSSSQKKNKEKLKNTCTKQERKRKNGHPHHFSSMTRQGFVDFDF